MTRQWVRPDHAEMTFAIGAHVHFVLWHGRLLHFGIVQVEERGMQFTFFLSHKSMKSFTVA
jgi:hypothetical protein